MGPTHGSLLHLISSTLSLSRSFLTPRLSPSPPLISVAVLSSTPTSSPAVAGEPPPHLFFLLQTHPTTPLGEHCNKSSSHSCFRNDHVLAESDGVLQPRGGRRCCETIPWLWKVGRCHTEVNRRGDVLGTATGDGSCTTTSGSSLAGVFASCVSRDAMTGNLWCWDRRVVLLNHYTAMLQPPSAVMLQVGVNVGTSSR